MLAAQANSAASVAEQPTSGTTAGQPNQHLLSLQRNDLGTDRRNHITTHDLDSIYGTLSTQDLERHRRVDRQSGRDRQQISSWNTAHLTLRDDDTYEDGLEDLNEAMEVVPGPAVVVVEEALLAPDLHGAIDLGCPNPRNASCSSGAAIDYGTSGSSRARAASYRGATT
ncbi:MAG: hypothetical protein Q9183_005107 [Haloplaca sp. 2 TL-2023]